MTQPALTAAVLRHRAWKLTDDEMDARLHIDRTLPRLSERERECFNLTSQALRVASIARLLRLDQSTVRSHLKVVFDKMGVGSQIELTELVWKARGRPREVTL